MTQHVQVPHELDHKRVEHQLEHGDKIIYASIRKYMNDKTRECFPSLITISKLLDCSKGKIIAAINRLLLTGLLEKAKDGRKNHYHFPITEFDKQFEMFTPEFFLNLDLPLNVKEYYMDIQQYLYGKETGVGKCSLSNAELSRLTGWTVVSIKKYNTILIEKNLLSEETSTTKTDEYGLPIVTKSFDLQGLQQAALWVKAVTEQVTKNTEDIESMKQELRELKAWKEMKEKEDSLHRNSISPNYTYEL